MTQPDWQHGWNTWNTRSVLSHVRRPDCFAISLGLKTYDTNRTLREALIGRKGDRDENVVPGPHAYDGSYTSLEMTWSDMTLRVETASDGEHWFARVTPLADMVMTPALTIEAAILWNKPGHVRREGNQLILTNDHDTVTVVASTEGRHDEPVVEITSPYLLIPLEQTVCITTNPDRLDETNTIIDHHKAEFEQSREGLSEAHHAMQTCLAWDTIYDPFKDRTISPVSRIWSCNWGGWVLFDWDTYFAAWMASIEHKELAYANAIAITQEVTERGFIPNMATASGFKSRDRSQPPVGGFVVQAICDRFHDTTLAEQVFDTLLTWNRWWPANRDQDGYLCWGSDPYEPITGCKFETLPINTRFASALESGLDNSPMYEDMPYDDQVHRMQLADVGLMSFYIADCQALANLAGRIGRDEVVDELTQRAEQYSANLRTLWCEETGPVRHPTGKRGVRLVARRGAGCSVMD